MALFSYFYQDELKVHWQDPKPDDDSGEPEEPFSLEVELGDFLKHYYRPILDFIGHERLREHLESQRIIIIEEADFSLVLSLMCSKAFWRKTMPVFIAFSLIGTRRH